jgi:C-terminal processing protease CtpA/Prc
LGLSDVGGVIVVTTMAPDGAAAESRGVQIDDALVAVDGVSTGGVSLEDIIARIVGPIGTSVTLSLARGKKHVDTLRKKKPLKEKHLLKVTLQRKPVRKSNPPPPRPPLL